MSHIDCLKHRFTAGIFHSQRSVFGYCGIRIPARIHRRKQLFFRASERAKIRFAIQIRIHAIQRKTVPGKKNFPVRNASQCIGGFKCQLDILKTNTVAFQLNRTSGANFTAGCALNQCMFRNHDRQHSAVGVCLFSYNNQSLHKNRTFALLQSIHKLASCCNGDTRIIGKPAICCLRYVSPGVCRDRHMQSSKHYCGSHHCANKLFYSPFQHSISFLFILFYAVSKIIIFCLLLLYCTLPFLARKTPASFYSTSTRILSTRLPLFSNP